MAGLWLLRHGALPPNPQRRFVGAREVALSDAGREQVRRAARALLAECGLPQVRSAMRSVPESEDVPGPVPPVEGMLPALPRRIVCSDLGRCRESATLVREVFREHGHDADIFPDAALREISLGGWEGLTVAEVEARWPGSHAARGAAMADFTPPGGESFAGVQARAVACVERWRSRFSGECLLLVSHAGLLRTLLCRWLALPLREVMRVPQHYACRMWLPSWPEGPSVL